MFLVWMIMLSTDSKNMPNIRILLFFVVDFNSTITYYLTKVTKFLTLLKSILQITTRKGLMLLFWRFFFI